jgi:hypothetical protein
LSDNEPKKPGSRDISDLKARLGLKSSRPEGGAAKGAKGTYVPPPPGVAPPQPAQPAVPDARVDPFGAMNAIAAQGAVTRAPEIIVVDKQHVEQVAPQSNATRYAKVGGVLLAPLVLGFLLGGINNARSNYNTTLRDAKSVADEFHTLGKSLEGLNNVLLSAKERGPEGKAIKLGDAQLVDELDRLGFNVPDADQIVLYHRNLYLLDPKLTQDILVFYGRMKVLAQKVKDHVRITKDMMAKLPPEARAKLGATSSFGVVVKLPTADEAQKGGRATADLVQLGSAICSDGKPHDGCPDGALTGFQVRNDTTAPWSVKNLASSDASDKVVFVRPSGVLSGLLEGSPRYLDELQYYQRVGEIDALVSGGGGDGGLVKERKDIEDRLNQVAQKSKAFSL